MNPALSQNAFNIIVEFIVLVFSLSVHEFAHAWTASRFGDLTARMLGRVTINPAKHIDPLGTIVVPLIALIAGHGGMLFGWAKPTPVTTRNLRNLKWSYPVIVLAGPISNFVLASIAVVGLCVMNFMASRGSSTGIAASAGAASVATPLAVIFYSLLFINLILGFFNLIPLPPLDGSLLLRHWLPGISSFYDRVGYFGLILTLLAGYYILPFFVGPAMAICLGIIRISG